MHWGNAAGVCEVPVTESVTAGEQFRDGCEAGERSKTPDINRNPHRINQLDEIVPGRSELAHGMHYRDDRTLKQGGPVMKPIRSVPIVASLVVLALAAPAAAQSGSLNITGSTGPKVGLTLVAGELADDLQRDFGKGPILLQFGWQVEARFPVARDGAAGYTQLMPLIGGLDQGKILPSVTWLIGVRGARGNRIGFGPTISLAGPAVTLSAGVTKRSGELHMPIDLAVQFVEKGMTLSLLIGFAGR